MGKLFEDGHAVELPESDFAGRPGKTWYQTHFDVNTSRKFHVVFDCTAHFKNVNLNDYLLCGPQMGNSLIGNLSRFRLYFNALVSDIKKMYYHCLVDDDDQDFLRFLWYKNNDFNEKMYLAK